MKTLKCTNTECGLELDESKFYKSPNNVLRGQRDYFCIACRKKKRKALRVVDESPVIPMSFCTGTCQRNRPVSDFYVRAEYKSNNGLDYRCKECRIESSTFKKDGRRKYKSDVKIDDEYIFC